MAATDFAKFVGVLIVIVMLSLIAFLAGCQAGYRDGIAHEKESAADAYAHRPICFRSQMQKRGGSEVREMWVSAYWDQIARKWHASQAYDYPPSGFVVTTRETAEKDGIYVISSVYLDTYSSASLHIGEYEMLTSSK